MKFRLKDRPLAVQIWFILGCVLGLSFGLLVVTAPYVLKQSFTNEIYTRLEESQVHVLEDVESGRYNEKRSLFDQRRGGEWNREKRPAPPINFRVVRHLYFDSGSELADRELPPELLTKIRQQAMAQKDEKERYFGELGDQRIMYVIRKVEQDGEHGYLVSYLWERYRANLVRMTLINLVIIIAFVLMISWIASIFIARRLTKPLTNLEHRVKEIAQRKWDQPVVLDRQDEIGSLGGAIEWMRTQLAEQNQKQQAFLQNVSHELKTPIMVIRSYVHSIQDGMFPGGSLDQSLSEIEDETVRLEERVRSLLHLSKLEYLTTYRLEFTDFNLSELIKSMAGRFSWKRSELRWDVSSEEVFIWADQDQLSVVLENLFDNQIRYANSLIQVDVVQSQDGDRVTTQIRVWNDGPEIEPEISSQLFTEFKKGSEGEYGLGLAIAQRIIDLHHGQIWVANEDEGVAFYIQLSYGLV